MDEAEKGGTTETQHSSLQVIGYPRDLLRRFTSRNHCPTKFAASTEDTEEIDLNLGLSLGGCFGVDPKEKKLIRSSSIAGLTTPVKDEDADASLPITYPDLIRTCSLPTEAEEEWRKRKQLQSLKRMEAKRKRSEKQRNFRNCLEEDEGLMTMGLSGKVEGFAGCPGSTGNVIGKLQQYMAVEPSIGLPHWGCAARGAVLGCGIGAANGKGNVLAAAAAVVAVEGVPQPLSQGSQGSICSEISEFESPLVQESNSCTEARSSTSVQSSPEQSEQKPVVTCGITTSENSGKFTGVEIENPSKKPKVVDKGMRETGRNVMEQMPCVSTRGDGPNGRRIEGFLYKYRKGEEVRIVCVCHGSFLSPADFVKHAGGGDVAHPLRHIVVNPTSSSLF